MQLCPYYGRGSRSRTKSKSRSRCSIIRRARLTNNYNDMSTYLYFVRSKNNTTGERTRHILRLDTSIGRYEERKSQEEQKMLGLTTVYDYQKKPTRWQLNERMGHCQNCPRPRPWKQEESACLRNIRKNYEEWRMRERAYCWSTEVRLRLA